MTVALLCTLLYSSFSSAVSVASGSKVVSVWYQLGNGVFTINSNKCSGCYMLGSHSGFAEHSSLLGCDAVVLVSGSHGFQWCEYLCLPVGLLEPEDEGATILQNVRRYCHNSEDVSLLSVGCLHNPVLLHVELFCCNGGLTAERRAAQTCALHAFGHINCTRNVRTPTDHVILLWIVWDSV